MSAGRGGPALALAAALSALLALSLAGAAAVAVLLAGGGAALLGPSPAARAASALLAFLTLAAAALAAAPLRRLLGETAPAAGVPPPGGRTVPRWLWLASAAALLLCLAVSVEHTLRYPDSGWDAWMIWNAKARMLLRTGGDVAAACSAELSRSNFGFHPDYPLLRPALVAVGFRLAGTETPWVPAGLSLFSAGLSVALLGLGLTRWAGARTGLLAALLLATTPYFVEMGVSGLAEAQLQALVLAAAVLLTCGAEPAESRALGPPATTPNRREALLLLAGLALGLAASVKNEGLLLLAAFVAAAGRRDAPWLALGALPGLSLLLWFKLGFAPPSDLLEGGPWARLRAAWSLERLLLLGTGVARRLVFFQRWGLHLGALLGLLAVRLLQRAPLPVAARRLLLACGLVLLGDCAVYLMTPHDLAWHVRDSLDRLLLQIYPVAILGLGLCAPEEGCAPALRRASRGPTSSSSGTPRTPPAPPATRAAARTPPTPP